DRNLTPKQQEYATTIHSSGTDLLTLINEILDLAKIESGQMEVQIAAVPFTSLRDYVERTFRELAADKGLGFVIDLDEHLPPQIYTDSQRLQQILRNLLSNAFKFTQRGQVLLRLEQARAGWSAEQEVLNRAETVIAFMVRDTGIGISPERQALVFEAFQQADGTTSREYGGTGLGLSISREIAALLGGEISLASRLGEGSIFTLYLPLTYVRPLESLRLTGQPSPALIRLHEPAQAAMGGLRSLEKASGATLVLADEKVADDRAQIRPGDPVLLIVEDDTAFSGLLLDQAHAHGFKGIVVSCATPALDLARRYRPAAITLDIRLPDSNGLILLDHLKHDAETRHIPVEIISITDEAPYVLQQGVIRWIRKPPKREDLEQAFARIKEITDRTLRHLLVVADDAGERQRIADIIGNSDVQVQAVASPEEGLEILKAKPWDCVVVDMNLPRPSGLGFIRTVRERPELPRLPIIAYARKALTRRQRSELQRLGDTLVIDGMKSAERLLYKTTLLLHRPQSSLPPAKQQILERLRLCDPDLNAKKVLVVDDDARNVFALTSLLESHRMNVLYAENAVDGLALLDQTPDIDIVLMDIMMPQMDGFEAIRRLRREERFKRLPIIAVTAKAMKGDREICLEAGASDYIAKPVDNQELLSRVRVWLNQPPGT
ncbi:MAG: response regulator, partial [Gammaproteobacteria bacterium]